MCFLQCCFLSFHLTALWNSVDIFYPNTSYYSVPSFSHLLSSSVLEGLRIMPATIKLLSFSSNTPFYALLYNAVLSICKPPFCLVSCSLLDFTCTGCQRQAVGRRRKKGLAWIFSFVSCGVLVSLLLCVTTILVALFTPATAVSLCSSS